MPRLGSYLAIKLEYSSCLFEGAFDAAMEDQASIVKKQQDNAEELRAFREEQALRKKEAHEAGETYEEEPEPTFVDPEPKPFITQKQEMVICLDTLGQDRKFTEDEIRFALQTVQHYKETWEEIERKNLQADIDWKLSNSEFDNNYKEFFAAQDEEERLRLLEDYIKDDQDRRTANGDEEMTDAEKDTLIAEFRFKQLTKAFYAPEAALEYAAKMEAVGMIGSTEDDKDAAEANRAGAGSQLSSVKDGQGTASKDDRRSQEVMSGDGEAVRQGPPYDPLRPELWQDKLRDFMNIHTCKYKRIWQSLFYLLKYADREAVCLPGTNCLDWKKSRQLLAKKETEDLFAALAAYTPHGPKTDDYKQYQMLVFLQTNLDGLTYETVSTYSQALAHLL